MAKNKLSQADKEFIKERAKACCEYCKFPYAFSHSAFHSDHITPPIKGGSEELENFAFACDRCNAKKWKHTEGIDPLSKNPSALFHPRKDNWNEHFTWTNDFTQVVGLTPKGRATIELLELNRPGLVNVRKALNNLGYYPNK